MPKTSKSKSEIKPEGSYTIDVMFIHSGIHNRSSKFNEIDKLILM